MVEKFRGYAKHIFGIFLPTRFKRGDRVLSLTIFQKMLFYSISIEVYNNMLR